MKKLVSILLSAVIALSCCTVLGGIGFASSGVVYYVDSISGSDDNDGLSPETAWAKLYTHSEFEFNPGDSILLKNGGVYYGCFKPVSSGTKENPITLSSYGDEEDGKPVMLSAAGEPTVFLMNAGGWTIEGLEFTARKDDGAGIKILARNGSNPSDYAYPDPEEAMNEPDEPEEPDEPIEPEEPVSPRENFKAFLEGITHSFEESWQEIKENVRWYLGKDTEKYDMTPWEGLPDDFTISNISIDNCVFHDMANYQASDVSDRFSPINIDANGKGSKLTDVTISNIEIYDCAYGIRIDGISREFDPEFFISEKESYNRDFLIENVSIRHCGYGGILLGALENALVRNCVIQNTCIYDDWFTAPLWTHHCDNVTMENIEVSGTTNWKDGMTVDFDGWTQNTTYQYIYSHDNVCFMKSNNFDNTTKNRNNTVRYCLSVNDNKLLNMAAFANASKRYPSADRGTLMDNFKFYNNTIINCAPSVWGLITNSTIANNIFVGTSVGLPSISLTLATKTKITNNCFYGMRAIPGAIRSRFIDPGFVGNDESSKDSFMLAATSKLIGKGIQVEEDMGSVDLFGNPVGSTHNIGCYEGSGESAASGSAKRAFSFIGKIIIWLKALFAKIFG